MRSIAAWGETLAAAWKDFRADQGSFVASGVAFRVAVAIFPAVALLVWVGGQLIGEGEARAVLRIASSLLPDSARSVVEQAVNSRLATNPAAGGGRGLVAWLAPFVGILFTVWSMNSGMKALFMALNVIFDTRERRSYILFTAVTLGFTFGVFALALFATALMVALPAVVSAFGRAGVISVLIDLLRWPVLFGLLALALAVFYRYAPTRDDTGRFLSVGSVAGSALLLLSTALFSLYARHFASFAVTYGSLSALVAFMLWLWVAFVVVLACAELDATIARGGSARRREPGSTSPAQPGAGDEVGRR